MLIKGAKFGAVLQQLINIKTPFSVMMEMEKKIFLARFHRIETLKYSIASLREASPHEASLICEQKQELHILKFPFIYLLAFAIDFGSLILAPFFQSLLR